MHINILQPRPATSRQQEAKPTRTGHKRALPPRHSFLTEAVKIALEKQSKAWEPTIDKNTVLCIVSEDELADCEEKPYESPPDPKSVVTPVPVFTVADKPPRRRRRAEDKPRIADVEPVPDEYYLRRHGRHEKEEKKEKNREKERLQHEMYQQQQFVDRIRQTDKSMIMAIVSSLRQSQKDDDEKDTTSESIPDIDVLYRQVLRDAEEQLQRYEMLGFSRKPRNKKVASEEDIGSSPPLSSPEHKRKESPVLTSTPPSLQSQSSNVSESASVSEPAAKRRNTSPTSSSSASKKRRFVSFSSSPNGSKSPSGTRRSARNIVAFGQKVPPMDECEFHLPFEDYGPLMEARELERMRAGKRN